MHEFSVVVSVTVLMAWLLDPCRWTQARVQLHSRPESHPLVLQLRVTHTQLYRLLTVDALRALS